MDKFIEPKNYITIPAIPVNFNNVESTKILNINKIKSLEDVKRILEFLHIEAVDNGKIQSKGFEKVKDLFE